MSEPAHPIIPLHQRRPEWVETGHINTTMIIARIARIELSWAEDVAIYCQMPDYFKRTYSAGVPLWAWAEGRGEHARLISTFLHGFHGGGPDKVAARQAGLEKAVRRLVRQDAPTWQIGFATHAFGDAYAHTFRRDDGTREAYGYPVGHALDFLFCEKPDHISQHPELYLAYCKGLYFALTGEDADNSIEFAEFRGAFGAILQHDAFRTASRRGQERIMTDFITRQAGPRISEARLDAAGHALDYDAVIAFLGALWNEVDGLQTEDSGVIRPVLG